MGLKFALEMEAAAGALQRAATMAQQTCLDFSRRIPPSSANQRPDNKNLSSGKTKYRLRASTALLDRRAAGDFPGG
jgi:hypothetical protein